MPLLDVVFLLLTFFAFALLVMVRAEVLDVKLPVIEAGQTAEQRGTPVVVTIIEDGSLAIDREPVERSELLSELRTRRSASEIGDEEFSLLLEVDVGSPSGTLIETVQMLREAGFDRFGVLGSAGDQPPEAASTEPDSAATAR